MGAGLPITINLPDHFLDKENRCGYEVSEKLKKIWAVELDLLQHLLVVCKKHKINVQVFAGTLLGAVRHGGMIPWDDDVDVAMSRGDFDKLCSVAPDEFKEPYFFQTALNDRKYFFGFARLRNSLTTGVISGNESKDYNNGIYIDVFPLDGLPDSRLVSWIQRHLQMLVVKCCTTYLQTRRKSNHPVEIVARCLRPVIRLLPFEWWYRLYVGLVSLWTKRSSRVCLRTHFLFGERYNILKSELEDTIEIPFENFLVPVPRSYDVVLSRIYGDYMRFPPKEERGRWHEGQIHFEPEMPYLEYFGKRNAK